MSNTYRIRLIVTIKNASLHSKTIFVKSDFRQKSELEPFHLDPRIVA